MKKLLVFPLLLLAGCSFFSQPGVVPPEVSTIPDTSVNSQIQIQVASPVETNESMISTPSEPPPEAVPDESPVKKRARIYVEAAGNVWIEYPDGEKLRITNGGGTTAGCKGGAKLHYQNPVLSSDEQYALLPLYCDGEEIETYIKEIATFRSKLLSKGEITEFKWDEVNGSHFTGPNGELIRSPYQIRTYESKELGLKMKMTDPFTPDEAPGVLKFGPVIDMDIVKTHRFRLYIDSSYRSAEQILKDLGTGEWFKIVPYQTTVGDFQVVISYEDELCGAPKINVIHEPRNFTLQPYCGIRNVEEELRYMKTVIRSIEKL